ncbi:hypothetical protein ACIO3O_00130 [Streptomyces sp. NPDC087440]|uniref:hypothetical protein n=1 Tax=Streptomyces sp. NPDC087440 TaxID=3365790 RepID=UPI0038287B51
MVLVHLRAGLVPPLAGAHQTLLTLLLGESQYARFDGLDGVTMQDISAILEAYGQEAGLGLGED